MTLSNAHTSCMNCCKCTQQKASEKLYWQRVLVLVSMTWQVA